MKKILKISGLAIVMILVVCFGFQYVQTNARENKPWTPECVDKKLEQKMGCSSDNDAMEQYGDTCIESKEYHIKNEEEKEKIKEYMKEAVENGGAFSDNGIVEEIE